MKAKRTSSALPLYGIKPNARISIRRSGFAWPWVLCIGETRIYVRTREAAELKRAMLLSADYDYREIHDSLDVISSADQQLAKLRRVKRHRS